MIAPDLRGYVYTEKPHTSYDKRTMAADILELMTALAYDRAAVIGHNRGARWVPNLPVALITGREEIWLRHFFGQWSHNPQLMTPEDIAEYVRAYQQPGAVMGACNDYRAGPQDIAQDTEDQDAKLTCPVLALWGADFEWVGKPNDVVIWADIALDLRTVELPGCRHLPHEEKRSVPAR